MSLFTTRPKAKYTIREVEIDLYLLPASKAHETTKELLAYQENKAGLGNLDTLKAMGKFGDLIIEYSELTKDDVYNETAPELALTYSEIFELLGALLGYSTNPLVPRPRK